MSRPRRADNPAELEAREAARTAKLDALHGTLTDQIAALRTGQDWRRWLTVATRFHNYSFNNVLLITAQRPDATAVAGYEAWKALGRQVDKGQRGIQILAPIVRRSADPPAGEAATTGPPQTSEQTGEDPQQRAMAGGARHVAGFRVVHVFDVTQTSGAPLPERPVPRLLAGQAPSGLWDVLANQVQARGFTLERGPCLGGLANGLTNYLTRTVTVRADIDDAQAVKTLAHELAHVLLHDPTAGAAAGPGDPPRRPGRPTRPDSAAARSRSRPSRSPTWSLPATAWTAAPTPSPTSPAGPVRSTQSRPRPSCAPPASGS